MTLEQSLREHFGNQPDHTAAANRIRSALVRNQHYDAPSSRRPHLHKLVPIATTVAVAGGVALIYSVASSTSGNHESPAGPSSRSASSLGERETGNTSVQIKFDPKYTQLATTIAHSKADQFATGSSQDGSVWPSGIRTASAISEPIEDAITDQYVADGSSCASGTIVVVRIVGSLNVTTSGTSHLEGSTSAPDVDSNLQDEMMTFAVDTGTSAVCSTGVSLSGATELPDSFIIYSAS